MSQPNSSDKLGTIEWEITEEPAGRTIYHGSRDVERNDIEIVQIPPLTDRIWPRAPKPWILSEVDSAIERVTGGRGPL